MKNSKYLDILQRLPCITNIPDENRSLWDICLHGIWIPSSLKEWKSSLDSLTNSALSETLFINCEETEQEELTKIYGFPNIDLPITPTKSMINESLAGRFDDLCSGKTTILRQSDIPKEILKRISNYFPDIAVFLIFDGLSFHDAMKWEFPKYWIVKREPCFVEGLTNTESSMPRLVGSPCLAHHLFGLGYKQRLGFSYWERSQNKLTDDIFAEFSSTQLHRVTAYEEILQKLGELDPVNRLFIQIVRNGMESYCHHHRERPDLFQIMDNLKNDIEKTVECLKSLDKTFRLFISSDHGILWSDGQKVSSFTSKDAHSRYAEGVAENKAETIIINENSNIYTILVGDNIIARNRSAIEWGFHGGLSAQESLIPLIDIISTNQAVHLGESHA